MKTVAHGAIWIEIADAQCANVQMSGLLRMIEMEKVWFGDNFRNREHGKNVAHRMKVLGRWQGKTVVFWNSTSPDGDMR